MEDYESTYFKYMIQEWKNNYIDYSDLLKFINDNINKVAILPSNEKDNIISNQENEPNQNEIIKLFKSKLNKELKKFYIFFIQQERELYLSINTRLHIKKKYNIFNNSQVSKEFDELIKLTKSTCDIAQYVYQNLYCLNKILIEFDTKYYNNFKIKSKLSLKYIIENLEKKNSDLLYIYQYKIINEISALVEDLIDDLIFYNYKFEDNKSNKSHINSENSNLQENLIIDDSQRIKLSNNKKITKLKTLLKNLELFNQNSNDIFLQWINNQKYEYYKKIICPKKNNNNELNRSNSLNSINISDENSLNVKISLIQNWFMYTCIYLIFPNIYSTIKFISNVKKGTISENKQLLCVLIIAMTPLGELISLIFISITISKSFKRLMILSTIFSFIGNLLFILGVFLKQYILIIFSRLFLGFGFNTTVNRNYLTEFIPKKNIELYLFYFKIVTLLGMASGPFITLITNINIYKNIDENDNDLNKINFSLPSFLCLLFSIFLFILIIIKYKEPNDDNFNIYSEGQKPIEQNLKDSFSLDESLTFHEFKHLKEINKRLSEFNIQNKYDDTNLVSVNINKLIENERAKNGNITRAFIFITLYLIITNITIFSFYVITPIFYLNLNNNESTETLTSLIFFITLLSYIPIYCINLIYISNKISSVKYILILNFMLVIFFIWAILTLYLSLDSKDVKEGNFIYIFSPCFLFIIINSYILENEVIAFLIKIIPDNFLIYNFNSYNVAHFIKYISELIGCLEGIFLKTGVHDGKILRYLSIFNLFLTIIILIWFYFSSYRFIDRPIRRIIYSKNVRLITRTEF